MLLISTAISARIDSTLDAMGKAYVTMHKKPSSSSSSSSAASSSSASSASSASKTDDKESGAEGGAEWEWSPVTTQSQESVWVGGRICCGGSDAPGDTGTSKLKPDALWLEGSRTTNGLRVKLNANELKSYSFFPGQVCVLLFWLWCNAEQQEKRASAQL